MFMGLVEFEGIGMWSGDLFVDDVLVGDWVVCGKGVLLVLFVVYDVGFGVGVVWWGDIFFEKMVVD